MGEPATVADDNGAPTGPTLVSADALGDMFGVTARNVRMLAREGTLPKPARGRFPLEACVRAYCEYLRKGTRGDGDRREAQTEFLEVKRKRAEFELKRASGDAIDKKRAEREVARFAGELRDELQNWPSQVGAILAAEFNVEAGRFTTRLESAVRTFLRDFALRGFRLLGERPPDEDPGDNA